MKFPLLIGARPLFVKKGPTVPLGNGRWIIVTDHTTSCLSLCAYNGDSSTLLKTKMGGNSLKIYGPANVYIEIDKAGDENEINAHAELINDTGPG